MAQPLQLRLELLDHRLVLAGSPPHLSASRRLRSQDAADQPTVLDVDRTDAVLVGACRRVRAPAAPGRRLRRTQHPYKPDPRMAVAVRRKR